MPILRPREKPINKSAIFNFLSQNRYGVVSTTGPDGAPQSALVGIAVTPDLDIVFDTLKSSRKYRNLAQRPQCSFVIGWSGEQTVQLEGSAEEPTHAALQRYQQAYFSAWPDGISRIASPNTAYLVVHPHWLRYSEFSQNPPLIVEHAFPH